MLMVCGPLRSMQVFMSWTRQVSDIEILFVPGIQLMIEP